MDGVEATRQIFLPDRVSRRDHPVRVVVLTTFNLDDRAATAIRYGASGFLLKGTTPVMLRDAIRTVHAGNAVLAPRDLATLLEGQFQTRTPPPASYLGLTDKEREVFGAVARGLSNTEVGAQIFASESTVKTHVGAILRKLGLRDRVQIVVFAHEHGLVRADPGSATSPHGPHVHTRPGTSRRFLAVATPEKRRDTRLTGYPNGTGPSEAEPATARGGADLLALLLGGACAGRPGSRASAAAGRRRSRPRMRTASSPALRALPTATVATGTPGRHLHDREQGVHPVEVLERHGNPDHGQRGDRGEHAGQVGRSPGAGDEHGEPAVGRRRDRRRASRRASGGPRRRRPRRRRRTPSAPPRPPPSPASRSRSPSRCPPGVRQSRWITRSRLPAHRRTTRPRGARAPDTLAGRRRRR